MTKQRADTFMDYSHANDVMYKPFDIDELIAKVRELLERQAKSAVAASS